MWGLPMNEELNGFKISETGYGFDEDGIYSYTRTFDTDSMYGLFKTRRDAILFEIEEAKKWIKELEEMLNDNS